MAVRLVWTKWICQLLSEHADGGKGYFCGLFIIQFILLFKPSLDKWTQFLVPPAANSVRICSVLFVIFHLLCALIIFLKPSSVIACCRTAEMTLIKDYYYYYYYYYLHICWFLLLHFMSCLSCLCFYVLLCCICLLSLLYMAIALCN
jgi:hypothetical protein